MMNQSSTPDQINFWLLIPLPGFVRVVFANVEASKRTAAGCLPAANFPQLRNRPGDVDHSACAPIPHRVQVAQVMMSKRMIRPELNPQIKKSPSGDRMIR